MPAGLRELSVIATNGSLTLVVMILVVGLTVKHSKDLENVAVTIITMELVPCSIETENKLPRLSPISDTCVRSHSRS